MLVADESFSANTKSQREKNRQFVADALNEADTLRNRTAELSRVWKRNSQFLREEEQQRRELEERVLASQRAGDIRNEEVVSHAKYTREYVAVLNKQLEELEQTVTLYQSLCEDEVRDCDELKSAIVRMRQERDEILQQTNVFMLQVNEQSQRMIDAMISLDEEIKKEEMVVLSLKIGQALGE